MKEFFILVCLEEIQIGFLVLFLYMVEQIDVFLVKKNMNGLTFAELRLQETIRYIDTMMTINTTEHARKLDSLIADHDLREEAVRILKERQESRSAKTN